MSTSKKTTEQSRILSVASQDIAIDDNECRDILCIDLDYHLIPFLLSVPYRIACAVLIELVLFTWTSFKTCYSYWDVWRFAKLVDAIDSRLEAMGGSNLLTPTNLQRVESVMPEKERPVFDVYQRFREKITELRYFYSLYVRAGGTLGQRNGQRHQHCNLMMLVMNDLSFIRGERISKMHLVSAPGEVNDLRRLAVSRQERSDTARRVYVSCFNAGDGLPRLSSLEFVVRDWLKPEGSMYILRKALEDRDDEDEEE